MALTSYQPRPCGECGSSDTPLRRLVQRNGAEHVVAQCQRCGRRSTFIPKAMVAGLVSDISALPETDRQLRESFKAHELATNHELFSTAPANDSSWNEAYDEYLASDKWARLREKVMTRSAGICEGCLEAPATEVHHLTYKHLGDELLWELVAVCRDCHRRCHPHHA